MQNLRFLLKVLSLFCLISLIFLFYRQSDNSHAVGVYWGAFDPPTVAHQAIITQTLREIPLKKIYVVVNNHNYKNYTFSLEDRVRLIREMVKSEDLHKVEVMWKDEPHKLDYAEMKTLVEEPLYVIAGYDSYQKWVNHTTRGDRAACDKIVVIPRGDDEPLLFDDNAFLLTIDACFKYVSSTKVREALLRESL